MVHVDARRNWHAQCSSIRKAASREQKSFLLRLVPLSIRILNPSRSNHPSSRSTNTNFPTFVAPDASSSYMHFFAIPLFCILLSFRTFTVFHSLLLPLREHVRRTPRLWIFAPEGASSCFTLVTQVSGCSCDCTKYPVRRFERRYRVELR